MFERMKRWYTYFAILLLNTLVLVVGITAAAYAYYAVRGGQAAPVYSGALHPRALHHMTTEEAKTFFEAFDRMGESETYLYQPWVEFSERVFHSDRLNVDEATPLPIRRTWRAPGNSQEPLIVWAFGGSTMFGWGVPDDETIASHLAKILSRTLPERAVTVVNHGHSYFFSSQELALFQTLLRRGGRGDFAVFLDGVNDTFSYSRTDTPAFSERMRAALEREQRRNPSGAQTHFWVSPDFPLLKAAAGVRRRLWQEPAETTRTLPVYDVVAKYQMNIAMAAAIGSMNGVKTLFFWQPFPVDPPMLKLAERVRTTVHDDRFHFIADLFNNEDPADLYVDVFHYGDTAGERVAEVIAERILRQLRQQSSKP